MQLFIDVTVIPDHGRPFASRANLASDEKARITLRATGLCHPGTRVLPDLNGFYLQEEDTDADGDFVANLEAYEGMLVYIEEPMSVTELFQLDRFGTIRLSANRRLAQFTEVSFPDAAGFRQNLKDIAARSLIFDYGQDVQYPRSIHVPGLGADQTLDNSDVFRIGDAYTGICGVISYSEDDQTGSEEPEYVSTCRTRCSPWW